MKQFLFFTLVMLAFIACNEDPGNVPRPTESVNLVIRASIEGYNQDLSDTRTTISNFGDPTYGLVQSVWSKDDEIAVYFYEDIADQTTLVSKSIFKAKTSGSSVEFEWVTDQTGTMPTSGLHDIKAIYPATIAGYYISDMPQTQVEDDASHIGAFDVMSALKRGVSLTDPDALKLSFTHEMPLLRFSLKNLDPPAGYDITIDHISINSSNTSNTFYRSISYNDVWANVEAFVSTEVLGLNCSSVVIAKNGGVKDFYMILPKNVVNDVTDNFIVSVSFHKNGSPGRQDFTIPRSENPFLKAPFAAGHCYCFKLVVSEPNIVVYTDPGTQIIYVINTTTKKASVAAVPWDITGSVIIPSTVPLYSPTCSVTSIDESVFGSTAITAITIPESIENIDQLAFQDCADLTTITFVGTSALKSIGARAFENSGLTSITIPASVVDIGESTFKGCTDMTEVLFNPGSILSSIGPEAFCGCNNALFDEIDIPSVKHIGRSAFADCSNLKEVKLSDNLESIDNYAFQGTSINELYWYCLTPPRLGVPYGIFTDLVDNGVVSNDILVLIYIPMASDFNAYNTELSDPSHPLGWTHNSASPIDVLTNYQYGAYESLSNASNSTYPLPGSPAGLVAIWPL